ncbi:MAG: hypothetical protein RR811_15625 [Comamonas sp.]
MAIDSAALENSTKNNSKYHHKINFQVQKIRTISAPQPALTQGK